MPLTLRSVIATPLRLLAFLLVASLAAPVATLAQIERHDGDAVLAGLAQQGEWIPGYGFPGMSGTPTAIAISGDRLFVGGGFFSAGNASVQGLAQFSISDQAWTSAGEGLNGVVTALAVGPEGVLYVGGAFTLADGVEANRIARYDPDTESWSALDEGMDGPVFALAVGDDGTLYAAGDFSTAGVVPAGGIAAWDGESWSSLGDVQGEIAQLSFLGGKLYAGGSFSMIGEQHASNVAAFDPVAQSWSKLGQGVDGWVTAMTAWGSWLYVGGNFDSAFQSDGTAVSSKRVARWDPLLQTWSSAALDVHWVTALGTDANGVVYAGSDEMGEDWAFARLIGDSWELIGLEGLPMWQQRDPSQIVSVDNRLAIGLSGIIFPDGNPDPAQFLYSFDPATDEWGVFAEPLRGGVDQTVRVLAGDAVGGVYVSGDFSFAGPVAAGGLAYLSGDGDWGTLGGGTDGSVRALFAHSDGTAYVGGNFSTVLQATGEGVESRGVARWDPAAGLWSPLGQGVEGIADATGAVYAMAEEAGGTLIAGGYFWHVVQSDGTLVDSEHLARWHPDHEVWAVLPGGHQLTFVYGVAIDETGAIYAGGQRVPAAGWPVGRLVRLAPGASEWELLGEWYSNYGRSVYDLAVWGDPASGEGELYAAVGYGVWRWSDSVGESIGGPAYYVRRISLNGVPGAPGYLYAAASPPDPVTGPWLWDGSEWSPIPGHVTSAGDSPHIFALDLVPDGEGSAALWVGGYFARAGEHASASLARWVTQDYTVSTDEPPVAVQSLDLAVFPNPLAGAGTVEFALPAPSEVRVEVFDLLGRRVMTLLDEERPAGMHRLHFPPAGLASGTYVVRLSADNETRAVLMTRVE